MESFLKQVAEQLIDEHPDDLSNVTVVFNNRRSGLFLRKHLAELKGKAFFLPQTIGIDELIRSCCNKEIVQHEFLLFELFNIHCQIGGENRKYATFAEFIPFGELMLSDFSEIDMYLVDAQQIFQNLYDLKEIDNWNVDGNNQSKYLSDYLQFYKSLYNYYIQLRTRLESQNQAYAGMAYREVAENIDKILDSKKLESIYFVGFNALSECELKIIKTMVDRGRAKYITDGDDYYYSNPEQEAGKFLNKHSKHFSSIGHYLNHFNQGTKDITIVNCPEELLQVKYAGQIISNYLENNEEKDENKLEETAIVLADENLLVPMLNSLPKGAKRVNITMGYPFIHSSIYTLTIKLLSLYQRIKNGKFYYSDIIDVVSDNIISKILGINDIYYKINTIFSEKKLIYLTPSALSATFEQIDFKIDKVSFLFEDTQLLPENFCNICRTFAGMILDTEILKEQPKELEALNGLITIVNYLEKIQQQYHYIDNWDTLQKIYTRIAQRHSISFYGEPLTGLQILGMLETRNLDFKRLIVISTNEGVLPSGRGSNTLIPLNLKNGFHIPTYNEKDAIFAYHFYRLLQRAEEVFLIYNSKADSLGKGEPSRFIRQIESELCKQYSNINLHHEVLSVSNQLTSPDSTSVIKSEQVLERLNKIAQKGFSPTALNCYRKCSLKFYYEYILSVKTPESAQEDIDQSEFGTCVHKILQDLHTIGGSGELSINHLKKSIETIDSTIEQTFDSMYSEGLTKEGKNHFLKQVAKKQIVNCLYKEIESLQCGEKISIKHLECDLESNLSITVGTQIQEVKISGTSDRIDLANNTLRVIDYKSGHTDPKDLVFTDSGKVSDKWFQVMQYAWLFNKDAKRKNLPKDMVSGIYPLGTLKSGFLPVIYNGAPQLTEEAFNTFENILHDLLETLFNKEIPFTQTLRETDCTNCQFKELCRR